MRNLLNLSQFDDFITIEQVSEEQFSLLKIA